jgi:glutamate--cysteine ligase
MNKDFVEKLNALSKQELLFFLCRGKKGIEKENIRIDNNCSIVSDEYPVAMGKALTHPYITKDYANAMLELVTPALENVAELFDFFSKLHSYVYKYLPKNLWASSTPPKTDKEVPIAIFGSSNKAKLKEVYRRGLKYRYGDNVQLFSGVHFNYSYHSHLLQFLEESEWIKNKNDGYFSAIRNFLRYEFFLLYLFGASPLSISEQSSLTSAASFPFATSIRAHSYQNKTHFPVSFNTLEAYITDLLKLTQTPDEQYQKIGIKKAQQYLQFNANQIQIENEFYYSIRPKSASSSGERSLSSLKKNGVDYLECRVLDLDPFSVMGIEPSTVYFLEVFFLFCLLSPSPPLKKEERSEILNNNELFALQGRAENISFSQQGRQKKLPELEKDLFPYLQSIADLLDQSSSTKNYSQSLAKQKKVFYNEKQAPSEKLKELAEKKPLQDFLLQRSKEQKKYFLDSGLDKKWEDYFQREAVDSIQEWENLEKVPREDFEKFLTYYFAI